MTEERKNADMGIYGTGNATVDKMGRLSITGNVIPPAWYRTIRKASGKPYLNAIVILADIVYWYRPAEVRDEGTGQLTGMRKRFKNDMLQRSYRQLAEQFGLSKRDVTNAVVELEKLGVVKRVFRTVEADGLRIPNILFLDLCVERLEELTYPEPDTSGGPDGADMAGGKCTPPADGPAEGSSADISACALPMAENCRAAKTCVLPATEPRIATDAIATDAFGPLEPVHGWAQPPWGQLSDTPGPIGEDVPDLGDTPWPTREGVPGLGDTPWPNGEGVPDLGDTPCLSGEGIPDLGDTPWPTREGTPGLGDSSPRNGGDGVPVFGETNTEITYREYIDINKYKQEIYQSIYPLADSYYINIYKEPPVGTHAGNNSNTGIPLGQNGLGTFREAREALKEQIRAQISYEQIRAPGGSLWVPECLDEAVELIAEIQLQPSGSMVSVNGVKIRAEEVQERFATLAMEHIVYVMDCMGAAARARPIRNIRAYLLTALYNAPQTICSYYAARADYDMSADYGMNRGYDAGRPVWVGA